MIELADEYDVESMMDCCANYLTRITAGSNEISEGDVEQWLMTNMIQSCLKRKHFHWFVVQMIP